MSKRTRKAIRPVPDPLVRCPTCGQPLVRPLPKPYGHEPDVVAKK